MARSYEEFAVRIERDGGTSRVSLLNNVGDEVAAWDPVPVPPVLLERDPWGVRFKRSLQSIRARRRSGHADPSLTTSDYLEAAENALQTLGIDLAALVLPNAGGDHSCRKRFLDLLAQTRAQPEFPEGVRLRIMADEAKLATGIPWEAVYLSNPLTLAGGSPVGHLGLQPDVSVVRTRGRTFPGGGVRRRGRLRVLIVSSKFGYPSRPGCSHESVPGVASVKQTAIDAHRAMRAQAPHAEICLPIHDPSEDMLKGFVQAAWEVDPLVVVSIGHGLLMTKAGCIASEAGDDSDVQGCMLVAPDRAAAGQAEAGDDSDVPVGALEAPGGAAVGLAGERLPLERVGKWLGGNGPALWIMAHCQLAREARAFVARGTRGLLAMQDLLSVAGGHLVPDLCRGIASGVSVEEAVSDFRRNLHEQLRSRFKGEGVLPDWCTPVFYLQDVDSGWLM